MDLLAIMKFVFLIVFFIFINTVKSHSTSEIIDGCRDKLGESDSDQCTYMQIMSMCSTTAEDFGVVGIKLTCTNFQHTYLPYVESLNQITHLRMEGIFSEIVIDSAYENLEYIYIFSTNLQTLKFEEYASFTKLSSVVVHGSKQVIEVDFTGVEKLKRLYAVQIDLNPMVKFLPNFCESFKSSKIEIITLSWNKFDSFDFSCVPRTIKKLGLYYNKIPSLGLLDFQNCEHMKSLSNLTDLYLNGNNFTDFNFACLPQNLIRLDMDYNQISTISNKSCQYLKNHTSLRRISLQSNNLQHFQLGCLPTTSIKYVDLVENNITEINDLADIPHSHPVTLRIHTNPIRCTCSFLRDYVQLLDSGNVTFFGGYKEPYTTITCANVDSELAAYPWGNDATAIRSYDASSLGCLTSEIINGCGNKLGESDSDQCTYMHIMSMCYTTAEDFGVVVLTCNSFQHTYLPYVEKLNQITHLRMEGNFSELVIDSAYENLENIDILSTNLQTLKFEKYASFTKLSSVAVRGSKQVIEVDFTGVEKLKRLIWVEIDFNQMVKFQPNFCESFQSSNIERIGLAWNKFDSFDFSCVPRTIKILGLHYNKISSLGSLDTQNCENMKSLSTLTYLYLSGNYFTDFNFACLPQNLINLVLYNNQISTISNKSCQYLKNHTSLRRIHLQSNNLQHFQFGCLPTSIEYVGLYKNNITEINDLSDTPHSHQVTLSINSNPIRCTCSLLRDYVQLLDSGNVTFLGGYEEPYTTIHCANVDSELAAYPWGNDAAAIRLYDASSLGCLTNGENTDSDID